jgi:4-amino-4-deoxy-L-arabinose transferase-like glycosyltransferase
MPPQLDYRAPEQPAFPWRTVFRIAALGPLTGGVIGIAQATAPLLCWLSAGQPDFYFRGWGGVDLDYFTLIIGGVIVGVPYGLLLWGIERFTRRQIRMFLAVPIVVLLSFLVSLSFAVIEFRQMKLRSFVAPECIAVLLGLLLSVITSRPIAQVDLGKALNK